MEVGIGLDEEVAFWEEESALWVVGGLAAQEADANAAACCTHQEDSPGNLGGAHAVTQDAWCKRSSLAATRADTQRG